MVFKYKSQDNLCINSEFSQCSLPCLSTTQTSACGSVSLLNILFQRTQFPPPEVTGASSGLGLSLVNAVLAAGERVIATLRKPENLKDLEAKYPREQLLVQRLDVTNLAEIKTVFDAARTHFRRLDVVVNNAGYGILAEIEATPDEAARHNFEVQFWGPVNITREVRRCRLFFSCWPFILRPKAIKFLRDVNPKGHGGLVINISSVGGYLANAGISFYNASKFGALLHETCYRTPV